MKHIVIKNFGPLELADVQLAKLNIIVGPQSSGKSCLLKVTSFCTWLEKRIQLTQNYKRFLQEDNFINILTHYHKLQDYLQDNTYIKYESDYMTFSYNRATHRFYFKWKDGRWNYQCPKVSYIPAERNLVAAIPNWLEVRLNDDNIRGFMSEWEESRKSVVDTIPILNLGVQYRYDETTKTDKVTLQNNKEVELTNTSSGLQSLIPLYVHLNYLFETRFNFEKKESLIHIQENERLLLKIYQDLFAANFDSEKNHLAPQSPMLIGKFQLYFKDKKDANFCKQIYDSFTKAKHNDIFLEEPEQNLFPPTQAVVMNQLLSYIQKVPEHSMFIATHSPYIVTTLLEQKEIENVSLFLTAKNTDGRFKIKTASEKDRQEIYDYGVDVFFNLESYV